MLTDIPKHIGGAKALFVARSDKGFGTVIRDDKEILIESISVCQYDPEEGFYLFGCDKEFNTHTDFYYDELEDALDDAKRLYKLNSINWTQLD
jgi:hypothetical protein